MSGQAPLCPICQKMGFVNQRLSIERRPDGNATCDRGHTFSQKELASTKQDSPKRSGRRDPCWMAAVLADSLGRCLATPTPTEVRVGMAILVVWGFRHSLKIPQGWGASRVRAELEEATQDAVGIETVVSAVFDRMVALGWMTGREADAHRDKVVSDLRGGGKPPPSKGLES